MLQPRFPALILFAIGVAVALPAIAQVTVNPKALEPLGGAPAASSPAHEHRPSHRHAAHHAHARAHQAAPAAEAGAKAAPSRAEASSHPPVAGARAKPVTAQPRSLVREPPTVPPAPPPVASLAPLEPPPPRHPAPPREPVPVVAGAPGEALPIPDGVRVTFGPDSADLNPQTDAALQAVGHRAATNPQATITVKAYAAGAADDPSTPRRVSLSRALAAREVLLEQGIGSTHIYLHALGAQAEDGPPDRVDVTVTLPAAAAARPEQ